MKRIAGVAPALAVCIALSGCGGGEADSHAGSEPTLAPAGAFKDGLMYAAIKARLAGADIDTATRISVRVHAGVVTLTGAVKDGATKAREVALVRAMRGVSAVNDDLRVGHVGPSTVQTVSDAAILAGVESALTAQAGINVTGVRVSVTAGRVTLTGHAPTAAVKSTLAAAAEHTPGVRNVVDRIAVKGQ